MMSSFLLEVGPILVLSNELHPSVMRAFCRIRYLSTRRRSPPEEGSSSETGCWGTRVTARTGQDLWGRKLASRGLQRTVCAPPLTTWATLRRTQGGESSSLTGWGWPYTSSGSLRWRGYGFFSLSTNLPRDIFWQIRVGNFIKCQKKIFIQDSRYGSNWRKRQRWQLMPQAPLTQRR